MHAYSKILTVVLFCIVVVATSWFVHANNFFRYTDTEAGFSEAIRLYEGEIPSSLPPIQEPLANGRVQWSRYWDDMTALETAVYVENFALPEGLPQIGIQAGHWQLETVPEELEGLKRSSGAIGGGYTEQETVLKIAEEVKALLEAQGVVVDLLPATVPPDYVADAFISIHADGSTSNTVSGYKISGPQRDFSGKSKQLVDALYESYGEATRLKKDSSITRRMSGYYAFNWRRYEHSIHPMTPAVIVETGFMTNVGDREVIVESPLTAAKGIANGVVTFLKENNRLPQ